MKHIGFKHQRGNKQNSDNHLSSSVLKGGEKEDRINYNEMQHSTFIQISVGNKNIFLKF
jgi:hypothetical protein